MANDPNNDLMGLNSDSLPQQPLAPKAPTQDQLNSNNPLPPSNAPQGSNNAGKVSTGQNLQGSQPRSSNGQQSASQALSEPNRQRLDGIVAKMQEAGESDSSIQFTVNDFKSKYIGQGSTPDQTQGNTQPESNQDSFFGRLKDLKTGVVAGAGQVASDFNPMQMVKGAGNLLAHPFNTAGNLWDASSNYRKQIDPDSKRGDYLGVAKDIIGEIPLVGPMAAGAIDQTREAFKGTYNDSTGKWERDPATVGRSLGHDLSTGVQLFAPELQGEAASALFKGVGRAGTALADSSVGTGVGNMASNVASKVGEFTSNINPTVKNFASSMGATGKQTEAISDAFQQLKDDKINPQSSMADMHTAVKGRLVDLGDQINKARIQSGGVALNPDSLIQNLEKLDANKNYLRDTLTNPAGHKIITDEVAKLNDLYDQTGHLDLSDVNRLKQDANDATDFTSTKDIMDIRRGVGDIYRKGESYITSATGGDIGPVNQAYQKYAKLNDILQENINRGKAITPSVIDVLKGPLAKRAVGMIAGGILGIHGGLAGEALGLAAGFVGEPLVEKAVQPLINAYENGAIPAMSKSAKANLAAAYKSGNISSMQNSINQLIGNRGKVGSVARALQTNNDNAQSKASGGILQGIANRS